MLRKNTVSHLHKKTKLSNNTDHDDEEETDEPHDILLYKEGNHIYFNVEVNAHTCMTLIKYLRDTERYVTLLKLDLHIDVPIYLHINSGGGCVINALCVVDVIKSLTKRIEIHSVVEGMCASAATLISVVCSKRYIRPNAFMMIHQLSSSAWGTFQNLQDEVKTCNTIMIKLKSLYLEHTGITEDVLNTILKRDITWNSKQCINNKRKLADAIYE